MILAGDYVRIMHGFYQGEVGIVKSFDGFRYRIELLNKVLEVKVEEKELEKISKNQIEEKKIIINFYDKTTINLKDVDLRYTCDCLKSNSNFEGLYALGKYYPKKEYPIKYNNDYFTQQILRIKNFNRSAAQEIAKVFNYFIDRSDILKNIVNKIDYICFMPNINYRNHVEQWGSILCEKLDLQEISSIIKIPEHKKDELKYYKYKWAIERYKIISGAFKINNNNLNLRDKTCLILDDICTTGLQINELSFTLAKAGCKKIYAFVIGRTKY